MLYLLLATLKMYNYDENVIGSTFGFMDKIKQTLLDAVNENAPEGQKYVTLEELKEQADKLAMKQSMDEADRNSRIAACRQIMEADMLGFLLLSYMKEGTVSLCSNLRDDKITESVLAVMRDTLYSSERKFKPLG